LLRTVLGGAELKEKTRGKPTMKLLDGITRKGDNYSELKSTAQERTKWRQNLPTQAEN